VDKNGVHGGNSFWKQSHESYAFDPEKWMRKRSVSDFDADDIGALAMQPPTFDEITKTISEGYTFLFDMSEEELIIAAARGQDRSLVLQELRNLPGGRLMDIGLY